jgi:hypothetical protein
MGVVKKMLSAQNMATQLILQPRHLLHHPHPTAYAATFPARGKAGARWLQV